MKFINYLKGIEGVGIFPIIALVLFVAVFMLVVITLVTSKKEYIDEMKNIPFSKGSEQ